MQSSLRLLLRNIALNSTEVVLLSIMFSYAIIKIPLGREKKISVAYSF